MVTADSALPFLASLFRAVVKNGNGIREALQFSAMSPADVVKNGNALMGCCRFRHPFPKPWSKTTTIRRGVAVFGNAHQAARCSG